MPDFDKIRRDGKITKSARWVVMPFINGGSLQSIMASSYPDGLPEPFIAAVLKEALSVLSYLHGQHLLHRNIKADNILIDSSASVKLADRVFSASAHTMLDDVAEKPYWIAPEVEHQHLYTGYGFTADIWAFGVTALELAYGRPPLSHLPLSKSMMIQIKERFRFSDPYNKITKARKPKSFSDAFKSMVGLCLDRDHLKRPIADELLKHPFFNINEGTDFLIKNHLEGAPAGEMRLRSLSKEVENVEQPRIRGWEFNKEGFVLDPVFQGGDDTVVKHVIFEEEGAAAGTSKSILKKMMSLKESLDVQRQHVGMVIEFLGGEESDEARREREMMQEIEKLRLEVENGKKMVLELEVKLEFMKLQQFSE